MLFPSVVAVKLPIHADPSPSALMLGGGGSAASVIPTITAVVQATFFAEDCAWFHVYEDRSTAPSAAANVFFGASSGREEEEENDEANTASAANPNALRDYEAEQRDRMADEEHQRQLREAYASQRDDNTNTMNAATAGGIGIGSNGGSSSKKIADDREQFLRQLREARSERREAIIRHQQHLSTLSPASMVAAVAAEAEGGVAVVLKSGADGGCLLPLPPPAVEASRLVAPSSSSSSALLGGVDGSGADGVDATSFKPLPGREKRLAAAAASAAGSSAASLGVLPFPSSFPFPTAHQPMGASLASSSFGVGAASLSPAASSADEEAEMARRMALRKAALEAEFASYRSREEAEADGDEEGDNANTSSSVGCGAKNAKEVTLAPAEGAVAATVEEWEEQHTAAQKEAMLRAMLERQLRRRERMQTGASEGVSLLRGDEEGRAAIERAFQALRKAQGTPSTQQQHHQSEGSDAAVPSAPPRHADPSSLSSGANSQAQQQQHQPQQRRPIAITTAENPEFGTLAMSIPMRMVGSSSQSAGPPRRPHICTTTLIADTLETHETIAAQKGAAQHQRMEAALASAAGGGGGGGGGMGGGGGGMGGPQAAMMAMAMGMGMGGVGGADGGASSPQSLFAAGLSERLARRFNAAPPPQTTTTPSAASSSTAGGAAEAQPSTPPYPFPFVFYVSCGVTSPEAVPLLLGGGGAVGGGAFGVGGSGGGFLPFGVQIYHACCQLIQKHHAFVSRRKAAREAAAATGAVAAV